MEASAAFPRHRRELKLGEAEAGHPCGALGQKRFRNSQNAAPEASSRESVLGSGTAAPARIGQNTAMCSLVFI
jgi:hypothetical protein